ncbi:MAG: hypothetical protein HY859_06885 [Caulobacterales bacterium]|nr:hypothetical protein [Caulobacterales bacterium]
MKRKSENFYRRDPLKALSGMIGLSLEERGVYNTVIDLLYSTWRPLADDRPFIAGWCGCAVQKVNPIINRLIEQGRLISFVEGGRTYISDEAFEAERAAVKGASEAPKKRSKVEEKSGEVEEKSAGVEQNPRLLDHHSEENQGVSETEKIREEKNTIAKAMDGGAVAGPPDDGLSALRELPVEKGCWRLAIKVLVERGGMADPAARSFIGKLKRSSLSDEELWSIALDAWVAGTLDPRPYLTQAASAAVARRNSRTGVLAPTERQQIVWMEDFRTDPGSWRGERGPRPGAEGCRINPDIQRRFGVEPFDAPADLLTFPDRERASA